MPHITFVHGIANKPPADVLLDRWLVALLDDDGLDLGALGVTTSMAYWADIMYAEPAPGGSAFESGAEDLESSTEPDDSDLGWLDDVPPAEREFVARLAKSVGLTDLDAAAATTAGVPAVPGEPAVPGIPAPAPPSPLEAIPLPGWLTKRLMRILLRDVHHYLYDAPSTPRPGQTYQVRRDVRARAVEALGAGAGRRPHIVLGHSLGSVIAYDVLSALDDLPPVDALVTMGSPLGLSEVQTGLAPPWTAIDGWPVRALRTGSWTNVSDRFDPVCGADPRLASDFRHAGTPRILDVLVRNRGSWRHSVGKYLGQPAVRDGLRAILEADGP